MKINKLEVTILNRFLLQNKVCLNGNVSLSQIEVLDRYFSGKGFITELTKKKNLQILKFGKLPSSRIVSCGFSVVLNSEINTGYLIYIEDGYINAIEGFTYGELWPEDINKINIYDVP